MNLIAKSLLATVATATIALGATAPASAQPWNGPGNSRFATEQCSRAAVAQAHGNARVTRIDSADRTGDGFRIRGEIVASRAGNHWGGWGHDRDHGSFTCRTDHGRIADLDLHGLH